MRLTGKRILLLSFLAFIFIVLGTVGFSFLAPSPRIIVSPQTTYLTEPLDAKGNIDYVEALRQRWSDGVTPENNAAVLLWQAMGPKDIPIEQRAEFFVELGLPVLPEKGEYFIGIDESVQETGADWILSQPRTNEQGMPPEPVADPWIAAEDPMHADYVREHRRREIRVDARTEFMDHFQRVNFQPWRAEDIPPLAEWITGNENPLNLVTQASTRPRYYSPPMVSRTNAGNYGPLYSMLLPDVQNARGFARALSRRAMLHVGEGRPQQAWQDLQSTHRLARLISQHDSLISQLVAIAIDGIALRADATLLHQGEFTPTQLEEIRSFLQSLTTPINVRQSIGEFERIMTLDAVVHAAADGLVLRELGVDENLDWFVQSSVDWNVPLRIINRWYDKLAAAAELKTVAERRAALEALDVELRTVRSHVSSPSSLGTAFFSRAKRSELAGQIMVSMFLPALSSVQNAHDRSATSLRLVQVAAALAVHRGEHGQYPESLDELSEKLRKELSVDLFSGKLFLYEKRGDGFVLYSVGENGTDDNASGIGFCITKDGEIVHQRELNAPFNSPNPDDIVLRVPIVHVPDEP